MSTSIKVLAAIQNYILQYGWPILFGFGSVGCILNICLFSRQYFRTVSCCLSSLEMFVVICLGIIPFVIGLTYPNPYKTITNYCKAHNYLVQAGSMIYRWLMVFACIDRYIHTSNNMSRQQIFNIRLTSRIIAVTNFIWYIIPIYQLFWSDIRATGCVLANTNIAIFNSIFTIIISGTLPTLIMLVCALLIRRNLRLKRTRRLHVQNRTQQDDNHRRIRIHDRQVLLMLLVQIFVYIVSNIPWTSNMIYNAFTRDVIKSIYQITLESYITMICYHLAYLYPVLSFYMYTLSSRTFREELMKMYKSCLICRQNTSAITN